MAKAAEEVKSGSKDVKSYFDFASEDEFNAYLEEVK